MLLPDVHDPHTAFERWFTEARAAEFDVPDAMQLATAVDGVPSVRTVLLKGWGPEGWVFYTNLGSQKARELLANPMCSALLHWKSLERQVRVVGAVSPVSDAEADAYFASRPRGSQIGAWASRQSEVVPEGLSLTERVEAVEERFGDEPVVRPPFWGGFRIDVAAMELWQGRRDRLHQRLRFHRVDGGWTREVLYP